MSNITNLFSQSPSYATRTINKALNRAFSEVQNRTPDVYLPRINNLILDENGVPLPPEIPPLPGDTMSINVIETQAVPAEPFLVPRISDGHGGFRPDFSGLQSNNSPVREIELFA